MRVHRCKAASREGRRGKECGFQGWANGRPVLTGVESSRQPCSLALTVCNSNNKMWTPPVMVIPFLLPAKTVRNIFISPNIRLWNGATRNNFNNQNRYHVYPASFLPFKQRIRKNCQLAVSCVQEIIAAFHHLKERKHHLDNSFQLTLGAPHHRDSNSCSFSVCCVRHVDTMTTWSLFSKWAFWGPYPMCYEWGPVGHHVNHPVGYWCATYKYQQITFVLDIVLLKSLDGETQ